MELGTDDTDAHVPAWISTRSIALDDALQTPGGLPTGRLVEIYGPEAVGKTTLLGHLCAAAEAMGGVAAVIDQEATLDADYFRALGANHVQVAQPEQDTFESGARAVESMILKLAKYDVPCVVGWDTIISAAPESEMALDFGSEEYKKQMGFHQAKAIKAFCRRIKARLRGTKVLLAVLNQEYQKIGVSFGNPAVAAGGSGLKYYASVRLRCSGGSQLDPPSVRGRKRYITVVKSKVSPGTGNRAEVALLHGQGYDNIWSIYEELHAHKLIEVSGGWRRVRFGEDDDLMWQGGWTGLRAKCAEQPEAYQRLLGIYFSLRKQAHEKSTAEAVTAAPSWGVGALPSVGG